MFRTGRLTLTVERIPIPYRLARDRILDVEYFLLAC